MYTILILHGLIVGYVDYNGKEVYLVGDHHASVQNVEYDVFVKLVKNRRNASNN